MVQLSGCFCSAVVYPNINPKIMQWEPNEKDPDLLEILSLNPYILNIPYITPMKSPLKSKLQLNQILYIPT